MADPDPETTTSPFLVVAQLFGILLVTPLVFGIGVAALAGPENLLPGALFGMVVGYFLARLRRDTFGAIGR